MILPTALAQELASQRSANLGRMAHYPSARSVPKLPFARRHPVTQALLRRLSRAPGAAQQSAIAPVPVNAPARPSVHAGSATAGSPMGCAA